MNRPFLITTETKRHNNMRLTLSALLFLAIIGISPPVYAGCDRNIAQCIYADSVDTINYNGLCVSTSCGNVHDVFNYLEFPDGSHVRVDHIRDGKELVRPETNGVLSTVIIRGESFWAVRTDEDNIYMSVPCGEACSSIDPDVYVKLKDQL